MTAGSEIAEEVLGALIEAGEATGAGRMWCVLKKPDTRKTPWDEPNPMVLQEVTAIETSRTERDGAGMVLRTVRMLLIDAAGPVVSKGDQIAVNLRLVDAGPETEYARIGVVKPLAPAGVTLLYKADMDD